MNSTRPRARCSSIASSIRRCATLETMASFRTRCRTTAILVTFSSPTRAPSAPGAVIAVRPIGVLRMKDEHGGDEKIVAVPVSRLTHRYENVKNYTDLQEMTWRRIEHFFVHYKDLEPGKWSEVAGWGDAEEARRLISEAIERAKQKSK